jgi:uncharacterized membrane protein YeaQ/YmgE (transglycosylase-associated protein family)
VDLLIFVLPGVMLGALAGWRSPTSEKRSDWLLSTLVGGVGGCIGVLLGRAVGFIGPTQMAAFIPSIAGAVALLLLHRTLLTRGVFG